MLYIKKGAPRISPEAPFFVMTVNVIFLFFYFN